eukprot:scaffold7307_cov125-Isochrysis_galbana.AAC.9
MQHARIFTADNKRPSKNLQTITVTSATSRNTQPARAPITHHPSPITATALLARLCSWRP